MIILFAVVNHISDNNSGDNINNHNNRNASWRPSGPNDHKPAEDRKPARLYIPEHIKTVGIMVVEYRLGDAGFLSAV